MSFPVNKIVSYQFVFLLDILKQMSVFQSSFAKAFTTSVNEHCEVRYWYRP